MKHLRIPRTAAAVATLVTAAMALTLAACDRPSGGSVRPVQRRPPNVVLVVIDALRSDALSINGCPYPTTPNIDALAREGVSFDRAFSHATWTKPSVATMLTSRFPAEHGLNRAAFKTDQGYATDALAESFETLPEVFSASGYATGALLNQVHLTAAAGFSQGFQQFSAVRGKNAFELNDSFKRWYGEVKREPFFFYLHYLDTHWPYTQKLPRDPRKFGDTAISSSPPADASKVDDWLAKQFDKTQIDALHGRYYYEVAYADAAVADLVNILRASGVYENTILVVTADHGEGFLEHGKLQHGFEPYDEVIRVPLVMRLPEQLRSRPGRRAAMAALVDIAPTLADLCGFKLPGPCRGISLRPAIMDPDLPDAPRDILIESQDAHAIRTDTMKLIEWDDGRTALFDLRTDPAERSPLAVDSIAESRELRQRLEESRNLYPPAAGSGSPQAKPLSQKALDDLKTLGYMQ